MKCPSTVYFTDPGMYGNGVKNVDNRAFRDGGWVGLLIDGEWVYYPPRKIDRIESRRDD